MEKPSIQIIAKALENLVIFARKIHDRHTKFFWNRAHVMMFDKQGEDMFFHDLYKDPSPVVEIRKFFENFEAYGNCNDQSQVLFGGYARIVYIKGRKTVVAKAYWNGHVIGSATSEIISFPLAAGHVINDWLYVHGNIKITLAESDLDPISAKMSKPAPIPELQPPYEAIPMQ